MKIVELRPQHDCENIGKALRAIADDIEAGAYEFDPTIAAVVLGREDVRSDRDGVFDAWRWQTHGLGKATFFTVKGLLAAAAADTNGQS